LYKMAAVGPQGKWRVWVGRMGGGSAARYREDSSSSSAEKIMLQIVLYEFH
jgi:hypothetical protein